MLAAPAEPGFLRKRDFHHRGAVRERAIAERADFVTDAIGEALEPAAQDLVVIASERIARNIGSAGIGQHVGGGPRSGRQIVHAR